MRPLDKAVAMARADKIANGDYANAPYNIVDADGTRLKAYIRIDERGYIYLQLVQPAKELGAECLEYPDVPTTAMHETNPPDLELKYQSLNDLNVRAPLVGDIFTAKEKADAAKEAKPNKRPNGK
jgi:hypothetical protein